jgi:hypothetical protein
VNILHATTDPALIARLKQMLGHSEKADIAVGCFFVSGFNAVAEELTRLEKVRLLVGRTDRQTLEAAADALQQPQALQARLQAESMVRRSIVLQEAGEVRKMELTGLSLIRRLEALCLRHKLNPAEDGEEAEARDAEVVRIICSSGLDA